MKVRFVPKNDQPNDPVNRMRCFDVIDGLRARGIDAAVYREGEEPDVLVILSLDFDRWILVAKALRAAGTKVVFDLSDNEFRRRAKLNRTRILNTLPHLWNPVELWSRITYFRQRQKFDVKIDAFIPECDLVTCSSQGIYNDVAALARARRLIPDVIDTELYAGRKEHQAVGREAKIVWTGLARNVMYMDEAGPALRALQREYGVEVRLITDPEEPGLAKTIRKTLGCEATVVRWSLDTIERELLAGDIGIAPYSGPLSKSLNKIATYWALALPVVASPLEEYAPVINDGERGYAARNDEEWRAALERLINDPALRQRQGDAGRALVRERYSKPAVCDAWERTLSDLLADRPIE